MVSSTVGRGVLGGYGLSGYGLGGYGLRCGALADRRGEPDGRSVRYVGVEPDPAAVVFDDLLRDGQSDAGTGVDLLRVQPLEDPEHLLGELGLDADPVVFAGDLPLLGVEPPGRDPD